MTKLTAVVVHVNEPTDEERAVWDRYSRTDGQGQKPSGRGPTSTTKVVITWNRGTRSGGRHRRRWKGGRRG